MSDLLGDTCSGGRGDQCVLIHVLSDFALRSLLRSSLQGRLKTLTLTAVRSLEMRQVPPLPHSPCIHVSTFAFSYVPLWRFQDHVNKQNQLLDITSVLGHDYFRHHLCVSKWPHFRELCRCSLIGLCEERTLYTSDKPMRSLRDQTPWGTQRKNKNLPP